ncbi:MAG: chemotaxis protein CheW [Clostridium sp.]|nr:chemotaxis protein CheW [Clostridium sp.]MCM1547128.1 chemotaxis protein CheW [Ruminococcus sp.]
MSNILNRFYDHDEIEQNEAIEISEKYLSFLIDNQYYAFHINDVNEIIKMQDITPVPEFPDYAKGIINLRGLLVPIIDVRLRFSKSEAEYDERTCIIVLNMQEIEVGFIVDTVDEVLDIDEKDISPVPKLSDAKTRKFISGVGKTPKKIIMLLDAQKMLNDEEIKSLEILDEQSDEA